MAAQATKQITVTEKEAESLLDSILAKPEKAPEPPTAPLPPVLPMPSQMYDGYPWTIEQRCQRSYSVAIEPRIVPRYDLPQPPVFVRCMACGKTNQELAASCYALGQLVLERGSYAQATWR